VKNAQPAEGGAGLLKYCSASNTLIGFSEPLERNIEEFLNHLVTYDTLKHC